MLYAMLLIALTALAAFLVYFAIPYVYRRSKYPPGPPGWPLIGNLLDIPDEYQWLTYFNFKEKYGPISSMTVPGKTIIILHTMEVCKEILEKNSQYSSGRPNFPFAGQLVGWDQQLILSSYNKHFRHMRRLVHSFLGTKVAAEKFIDVQEAKTRLLVKEIHNDPNGFVKHLRTYIGAMLLRMSHGYLVKTDGTDPFVNLIEEVAADFYEITKPGRWLVDLLPCLKHVPDWMPGAGFKEVARRSRKRNFDQSELPYQFALREIVNKTALPSFVRSAFEARSLSDEENHALKHSSAAIYGGGLDTMTATCHVFMLLMILHPEVQRKLQAELDDVIGTNRFPSVRDRANLPFFNAVQKEVYRWHPIGPLGIPHEATEDLFVGNYLIPKAALLISNIWRITHDAQVYDVPMAFKPERFLDNELILDPTSAVFGFGRRMCPGIELAHSTVFVIMATCLFLFNLTPAKNENGVEIPIIPEFQSGTVSHPKPFQCRFEPRSVDALDLLSSISKEE